MTIETTKPTSDQMQSAIDHLEGTMTPTAFDYRHIRRERAVNSLKEKREALKDGLWTAAAVGVTAVTLAAGAYEYLRTDSLDPTQAPIAQTYEKILIEGQAARNAAIAAEGGIPARNTGMNAQGNIQVAQP